MASDGHDPSELHDVLREVHRSVCRAEHAPYDGLDALLSVCVDTVPGADAAAISHSGGRRVRSTHATDGAIAGIDGWHNHLHRGPLLEEARRDGAPHSVLLVDDLVFDVTSGDTSVRVLSPLRALHSTTLRSRAGRRTALDLYAADPGAFGLETTVLADMFVRRAISLLFGPEWPATRPAPRRQPVPWGRRARG